MSGVLVHKEIQSELNDSLAEYLKFIDQEREEIKRQKIAARYAERNLALHLGVGRTKVMSLVQRLNRLGAFGRRQGT